MVINDKSYVLVTSGTQWKHAAAVLNADLQTLTHTNLDIAVSANTGWSNGGWADWYWDETEQAGYLAVWFERYGLLTYKLTHS
jgi:aspartate ammonia-lyase